MLYNIFTDNESLLKASYVLSHNISKCQASFTIVEKLVMPSVVIACREILGPIAATKISEIPLFNDNVTCRIQDMADDIESQVLDRAHASNCFAIRLEFDETDISNAAQLLVYKLNKKINVLSR